MGEQNWITGILIMLIVSGFMLVMGIVHYMITIWVIKMSTAWAEYDNLEGNMVVLTAGIVTAASMIGSALKN